MSENDKDWGNPIFRVIYVGLASMEAQSPGVCDWLNANGFANLTVCPECHEDDFTHVAGCAIATALQIAGRAIEDTKTGLGQSMQEVIAANRHVFVQNTKRGRGGYSALVSPLCARCGLPESHSIHDTDENPRPQRVA